MTAVEDKLQDEAEETLQKLKEAGLPVWMLTGDKVETACCVAMSCGLVSKGHKLFKITAETDLVRIDQLLDKFS